jgi:hypothetical protein
VAVQANVVAGEENFVGSLHVPTRKCSEHGAGGHRHRTAPGLYDAFVVR